MLMLENLNARTFADFGQVYEEKSAFSPESWPNGWQRTEALKRGTSPAFFSACPDAELIIDFVDGMTAICVAAQEGAPQVVYYLDKLIHLRPGVLFCLIPLGNSSTVSLYCREQVELVSYREPVSLPPLFLAPSLNIPRIHTLFYQEKPKGFFFRGEKHLPYELTYVDRGHMHCIVAGENYALQPHDILLSLPDQWHIQYADRDEASAFITVSFDMQYAHAAQLGGHIFRASEDIIRCFDQLLEEQRAPSRWSADRLILLLTQIMLAIRDLAENEGGPRPGGNENYLVDQALRYIEANLNSPLSVSKVASHVCVSPSYLAVLFREHLRMTPTAVLRKLKLEESRRLIRKGELTISQVAQHLGFATLQHFSRCFTEYFGMGPRAYIKSLRASQGE